MDNLFEQATQITRAHAYGIVSEQVKELQHENAMLKIQLKHANALLDAYKDFINDVRPTNAISAELPNRE